jgi:hypothetical protein
MSIQEVISGEKQWDIHHGDCIYHMAHLMEMCDGPPFDFSIFSPPFNTLYAYSSSASDLGNSEGWKGEAKIHLSFFYQWFARMVKPGRAIIVHISQIPRMKRSEEVGLFDFRGLNIRLAERAGLVFEYDWLIRKNPQAQAIRTHSHELQFAGLEKDRAACRGSLSDYLLKFRAPGYNAVPVANSEVSRNDWIKWAEPAWMDIEATDTLNVAEGDGEDDTKHICPLQLEVIRRCVLLFTNPGEIVFTPFAGIGSELFMSIGGRSPKTKRHIDLPRRAYGCELKDEYLAAAKKNLARAEAQVAEKERILF